MSVFTRLSAKELPIEFKDEYDCLRHIHTQISLVPPDNNPWDPVVVKALKEVEPTAIPVWVERVYRTPAGTDLTFGYHGVYKKLPMIDAPLPPEMLSIHNPRGTEVPNYEWILLEGEKDPNRLEWPGAFIPFDMQVVTRIKRVKHLMERAPRKEDDAADREAFSKGWFDAEMEKRATAFDPLQEEMSYRVDQEWPELKRIAGQLSGPEYDQIGQPREHEAKPFVYIDRRRVT